MHSSIKTLLILVSLFPSVLLACSGVRNGEDDRYRELVWRAKNIVLVEATKFDHISEDRGIYTFKSVRLLKGTARREFRLSGYIPNESKALNSYKNHTDARFWAWGGRVQLPPDCIFRPWFVVGQQYLLFLKDWDDESNTQEPEMHFSSFERIESESDLWLQTIQELSRFGNT